MKRRNFLVLGGAAAVAPLLPAVPIAEEFTAEALEGILTEAWMHANAAWRYRYFYTALGFAVSSEDIDDNLYADIDKELGDGTV